MLLTSVMYPLESLIVMLVHVFIENVIILLRMHNLDCLIVMFVHKSVESVVMSLKMPCAYVSSYCLFETVPGWHPSVVCIFLLVCVHVLCD